MDDHERLKIIEERVNQIYESVEKTRMYFKWTMYISIAVIVLPLLASVFIIPLVLKSFSGLMSLY